MSNHQHTTTKQGNCHNNKGWGSKCIRVSSPRVSIFIHNNIKGQGLRCSISSPWFLFLVSFFGFFFLVSFFYYNCYLQVYYNPPPAYHETAQKGPKWQFIPLFGPWVSFFFFPFFSIFSFLLACSHLGTLQKK